MMVARKSVGSRAISILFPTWKLFRRSLGLFKADFDARAKSLARIKDLYSEAIGKVYGDDLDAPGAADTFEAAREKSGVSLSAVYRYYLTQKRIALIIAVFLLCTGFTSLFQGHWLSLIYMVIGPGLCIEIAWVSEFRLWQCRIGRLSNEKGGSIRDFWATPRAWLGALDAEPGHGLIGPQRLYMRWVWIKRFALSGSVLALGTALFYLDGKFQHKLVYAVSVSGVLLAVALLAEFRLRLIRADWGITKPRLGWASFEYRAFCPAKEKK